MMDGPPPNPPPPENPPIDLVDRRKRKRKEKPQRTGWEANLTITDKGEIRATASNIVLVIDHAPDWGGRIRYDERSDKILFVDDPPWVDERGIPREITDTDYGRISIWLERHEIPIVVGPESRALDSAIKIIAERHRFDPVRDYLDALQWDRIPRLDRWLATYLGATDTRLHRAVGAMWLISAVARVFEPGCQADHMLVLIGSQGAGKSTALKILAGEQYFGDALPDLKHKDAADYLRGLWIVEASELESLTRSEVTTAKAFFSRREDRYRAAYARCTATHPRRCVFAGSTNDAIFLRDGTGNRRFWPVQTGKIDLDALARDRDQLWAEAVHRCQAGDPWWITDPQLSADVIAAQESRLATDAWEPVIADWLDSQDSVTVGEILSGALQISRQDWTPQHQTRVAKILQRLGWERTRRRVEGERQYIYVRADGGDQC
jgi:predicted P-loop ATPase